MVLPNSRAILSKISAPIPPAIQNRSRPARITSLGPGPDEATNYFAGAGWGAACGAGVTKFTFGTSRDPSAALK